MLLLAAACARPGLLGTPEEAPPPNVLLVVADDLGWTGPSSPTFTGGHGSDFFQTPVLDALAEESVVFTSYWASPNCSPGRAALLSGQHGFRTGVLNTDEGDSHSADPLRPLDSPPSSSVLPDATVTLAEALRDGGYRTVALGKWHLGDPDLGQGPPNQGFEVNRGGTGSGVVSGGSDGHFAWEDGRFDLPGLAANGIGREFMADRLSDEAIAAFDLRADEPVFVYLAHFSVHTPIQAPPSDVERFRARPPGDHHDDPVVAAMLWDLDRGLGRIVDHLRDTDDPRRPGSSLLDDTLLIVTSDNGGQGGYDTLSIDDEHDTMDNWPLRGGKGMLTEVGLRTPMLVHWPAGGLPSRALDAPVQNLDVFPTVAEAAGVEADAVDGVSLMPMLRGQADEVHDRLFVHFPVYVDTDVPGLYRATPTTVERSGPWKLWYLYETASWELYDLSADLGEAHELADQRPDVVADLGGTMRDFLVRTDAPLPTDAVTGEVVPLPTP
jgi:arylsulfatase A-like enzyme